MRRLHAVGLHESFVASGQHQISWVQIPGGAATSTETESWSLHALPDGSHLFRADRQGAAARPLWVLEALRDAHGRIQRLDRLVERSEPDEWVQVRSTYTFFVDHVQIGWAANRKPNGDVQHQEMEWALVPGYQVNVGAAGARGWLLQAAAGEGCVPVFAPAEFDGLAPENIEDGVSGLHTLCAWTGAVAQLTLPSQTLTGIEVVYGAVPDWDLADGRALVDRHGIMLLDSTHSTVARLMRYARRPA